MAAAPQDPIDLFYWPTPNGWKISIMLEECGLPIGARINIGKGDQFKPDFLAISPNNKMPAIVDPKGPDGKPISIFESGAILQYLGRKTGRSTRSTSAGVSNATNGSSGRWAASAPCSARRTISASTRPKRSLTPSTATRTRRTASTASSTGALRTAPLSPATTRSPTWRSTPGRSSGSGRARTSTISRP